MNKKEFINGMAERYSISKKQASQELKHVLEYLSDVVSEVDEINLTGYLKVKVKEIEERMGHNPQTQEKVMIPAHKQVRVSVGNKIKQAVK